RFEKRPLDEALEELAELTGAPVVVDSRLGDKAKTPVTATFRNTTTLENAVRLLAEMADLQAELDDYAIVVVAKPKLDGARQSELNLRGRWRDLALRDLARWTGRTIVLDPEVDVHKISLGEGKVRRVEVVEAVNEGPAERRAQKGAPPSFKITATFKPSISAEAAVRIVADQARLSVVMMDGAFYVTTPSNAQRLRQEMAGKK